MKWMRGLICVKKEKKGSVLFSLLPFANLVHRVTVKSCIGTTEDAHGLK